MFVLIHNVSMRSQGDLGTVMNSAVGSIGNSWKRGLSRGSERFEAHRFLLMTRRPGVKLAAAHVWPRGPDPLVLFSCRSAVIDGRHAWLSRAENQCADRRGIDFKPLEQVYGDPEIIRQD